MYQTKLISKKFIFAGLFSFALILSGLSATVAKAADPCDPTVKAVPSHLTCQGKLQYEVEIDTLMSSSECPFNKHVEVSTAEVEMRDTKGNSIGTLKINPTYFEYTLGAPGMDNGTFSSKAFSIDLKNCMTPAFNGLSAGN